MVQNRLAGGSVPNNNFIGMVRSGRRSFSTALLADMHGLPIDFISWPWRSVPRGSGDRPDEVESVLKQGFAKRDR